MKGTEYAIVAKAYNVAGSGPQSHEVLAYTKDGDYPPAQQLNAIDSDSNTISLRWYQKDLRELQIPIISYTIHYKREDEPQWLEIPVTAMATETPVADASPIPTYSYVLQNLESGTLYKIFITAINRYGFSDPSNIISIKTKGGYFHRLINSNHVKYI
jgi:hypothetical protein